MKSKKILRNSLSFSHYVFTVLPIYYLAKLPPFAKRFHFCQTVSDFRHFPIFQQHFQTKIYIFQLKSTISYSFLPFPDIRLRKPLTFAKLYQSPRYQRYQKSHSAVASLPRYSPDVSASTPARLIIHAKRGAHHPP